MMNDNHRSRTPQDQRHHKCVTVFWRLGRGDEGLSASCILTQSVKHSADAVPKSFSVRVSLRSSSPKRGSSTAVVGSGRQQSTNLKKCEDQLDRCIVISKVTRELYLIKYRIRIFKTISLKYLT